MGLFLVPSLGSQKTVQRLLKLSRSLKKGILVNFDMGFFNRAYVEELKERDIGVT